MTTSSETVKYLAQPIRYLKGVGPKRAELLAKLGIQTLEDLIYHYPREYQDRTRIMKIRDLQPQDVATIQGTIQAIREIKPFGRSRALRHILKVAIVDETGMIFAVWFNQSYRVSQFEEGKKIILTGKTRFNAGQLELDPIEYEVSSGDEESPVEYPGIVPIYPLTESLDQRFLRRLVNQVFEQLKGEISEVLPETLLEKYKFLPRDLSIRKIHFPDSTQQMETIRNRFIYEELFFLQLTLAIQKSRQKKILKPQKYKENSEITRNFIKGLPFKLTGAQLKVLKEIAKDLKEESPMHRLLQGDVGSGKTLVALVAMLYAMDSGYQSVLMVPTEVLAEQHYRTFEKWLKPLGIPIGLLTGSVTAKHRKEVISQLKSGNLQIVIGTHALIEHPVEFKNLALVVIDEQHRFGVIQRNRLRKKGEQPDILVMTATPIPRTLSMTVYGDLDVSVLDEMPPGRSEIITKWYSEKDRQVVYLFLRKEIKMGRQVYLIYPLVEESDKMELKAAVQMYDHLRKDIFPDFRLGLIHGRMNKKEQQPIMEKFSKGELDMLISTTVIEVGIDVPNASVMVIEHADRFGLSQLHQLRGRVGRGKFQSYCMVISGIQPTSIVRERLTILTQTMDGFMIAEQDLRLRGPGETLGTMQHGKEIFKIADFIRDQKWLIIAREDAFVLIKEDPELSEKSNIILKEFIKNRIGPKEQYANVA